MKPIYNSQKTIFKSLRAVVLLFLATLLISSLFTSCTTDEIEVQTQKVILKEIYFQRNDTILNDTIPTNTSTTTNGGEIDPPIIIQPKKP